MMFHKKNNLNMMFMSGSGKRLITGYSCNRKFSFDAYGFWGILPLVDQLGFFWCYDLYVSCNVERIKPHRVLVYYEFKSYTSYFFNWYSRCVANNWCEWEESIFMITKWNYDGWRLCVHIYELIFETPKLLTIMT